MTTDSIDSSSARPAPEAEPPKPKRKRVKKAKREKKATKPKKPSKPKAERANKKGEVIALINRAKGATLAGIMKATGWQLHTVRGFVSVLGGKGGHKIESSKTESGERTYRIVK